jgi:polyphosphate glucokinase
MMNILVIDIGGTHIKLSHSTWPTVKKKFSSGVTMTPHKMLASIADILPADWQYDSVSIGYPGIVKNNQPVHEPFNLAGGWLDFDFQQAFSCPIKIINDAAMQALGNYQGGKMLFLGLGTGLGSAMIVNNLIIPMELAHLPYRKGRSLEDFTGLASLQHRGRKKWQKIVFEIVQHLQNTLLPDEVVLGGGNAHKLKTLPAGCRRGDDNAAFNGGFRLWSMPG